MSFGMHVTPGYYPAAYVMWQPAQSAAPQAFAIPQPMPAEYFAQGTVPLSGMANAAVTDKVEFNRPMMPSTTPNPGVYNGIQNHGVQRYLPINERRDFSDQEQVAIRKGLKQWWPKIGAGYTTPIPQLLASPVKASLLSGLLGGLVSHAAHLFVKRETALLTRVHGPLALAAILLFAVLGFINRRQSNENILDLMSRLPEGSTKRDLLSDPVYQADLQRKAAAQRANMSMLMHFLILLADSESDSKK